MPRHGKKRNEQVDSTDDAHDADPVGWTDEEDDNSSDSEHSSDVGVLKQLILHGFEVKGKLIDGKLQYVFRTPKFIQNRGISEDSSSVNSDPAYSSPRTPRVTWADSLPESPPSYSANRYLESAPVNGHNHRKPSLYKKGGKLFTLT